MQQETTRELTAAAILAQIEQTVPVAVEKTLVDAFRQAAAVLAAISDVKTLEPFFGLTGKPRGESLLENKYRAERGWEDDSVAERLLHRDLVPASAARLGGSVMLQHKVRRDALRTLGTRERMVEALSANPRESLGPVQHQFECYLRMDAAPVESQSRDELEATLQVLLWLDGIVSDLPSIEEVQRRLTWIEFIAPFEALAGDSVFCGRTRELEELRSFVGVLKPVTLLGYLRNAIAATSRAIEWLTNAPRPALSVYGPGGVGKSALIARFILEHSRLPPEARIPFAYLDFDRCILNVAEPETLLREMEYQLMLQFPDEIVFAAEQGDKTPDDRLRHLLAKIRAELGERPYLIMFDTFEQVQYRGEGQALTLWRLLATGQQEFPFVRVVVSGRTPATTLNLSGTPAVQMRIGELDAESAVAFVEAAGIRSHEMAEAVVRQVGGVPLSLKLAATLLRKAPNADLGVRSGFWMRAADEVIQGQLYDRILGQISDFEVARVAHPGLVLRRITPELLLEVLRVPCQLTIENIDQARELFEKLRREVSLVSADDAEGALVHRRDLREVMLKLLRDREQARSAEISRRAVQFYSSDSTPSGVAERTYHQLLLSEPVDKIIFEHPDVRASLQASIADLPIVSQQLLASYGFDVNDTILRKASTEQREALVASQLEDLLPHGKEGGLQGLRRLQEIGQLQHDSPLWRSLERLSFEAGDHQRAAEAIEHGLRFAAEGGSTVRILQLLTDKAWQCQVIGKTEELPAVLEMLADHAERHDDNAARLQHWLQACDKQPFSPTNAPIAKLFGKLRPREFVGLLPAMRPYFATAASARDGQVIAELILAPESTFAAARFADRHLQHQYSRILEAAYSIVGKPAEDRGGALLAQQLLQLIEMWPYRNIHVHPPQALQHTQKL